MLKTKWRIVLDLRPSWAYFIQMCHKLLLFCEDCDNSHEIWNKKMDWNSFGIGKKSSLHEKLSL